MSQPDITIRVFHHDFPKEIGRFDFEDIRFVYFNFPLLKTLFHLRN